MDYEKIRIALESARRGASRGEVPIGAVVARGEEILSSAHNRIEELQDPTAHAEVLAIREATSKLQNWRLSGCTLYVTLEPCAMCLGAARLARVERIVYGAGDSRFGAVVGKRDWSSDPELGPVPIIVPGLLKEECSQLLKDFFKDRR